jgi:hypothetical protein
VRPRALALVAAVILVTSVTPVPQALGSPGAVPPSRGHGNGALTFSFAANSYTIRTLAPTQYPYYTTTVVPLVDPGVHDAAGVRMYRIGSTLYNHPVDQAQYAIANIYSYLATGTVAYLDRARAQAQRLIDTSVASRGAMYFPYPFNFARHGVASDTMIAPWYSAMAQGQALTVFVRLFEITGDLAYRTAADLTFNSFKNPRAAGMPWTVLVDSAGYIWFEEYAGDPRPPDLTYNGHQFAIFGLWDYHRLTGSPDALLLLRGGLTTASRYFPNIRAINWISRYCLTHGVQNALYHAVHGWNLLTLYTLTGALEFARGADFLNDDYPWPNLSGTLAFSAGTFTGYRFSSTGAITASKTFTLSQASSAPFLARSRIFGRAGTWFLIGAGVWSGYWILETPRRAFAPGRLPNVLPYDPPRTATFSTGTHTGLVFNASGGVTASRTAVLARPSSAPATERAVINGVPYLYITAGIWAGMYMPLSAVMTY